MLSTSAVWLYLFLLMVIGCTGLWWHQEQLRKRYQSQQQAVSNDDSMFDSGQPHHTNDEETDTYELMDE
jgi:hypothetical protein